MKYYIRNAKQQRQAIQNYFNQFENFNYAFNRNGDNATFEFNAMCKEQVERGLNALKINYTDVTTYKVNLDFEGEQTTQENAFSIIKYYNDFTFNSRGTLQLEVFNVSESILTKYSLCIPQIYDFVKNNQQVKTSIGTYSYDNDYLNTFNDKLDVEQIVTLIDICSELNTGYKQYQTIDAFLENR